MSQGARLLLPGIVGGNSRWFLALGTKGLSYLHYAQLGFRCGVSQNPRLEGVMIVIWESLNHLRRCCTTGDQICEILFIKLNARDQLGLLLLYQSPCCTATPVLELLNFIFGLAVEFLRFTVWGGEASVCLF